MITATALIEKFKYALDNKWGYIWGTRGIEWTKARQEALEKTTDADRANGRKYGAKWIGHMVADCSGLFTWAFAKLGGEMYHGSNTMYLRWCVEHGELKKGVRSDGKTLKPGTAVFVWNGSTYSHVGLFIGDGTVIEAANTQKGVIASSVKDSKWSHWGELKGVSFDGQPSQEPALPTLRKGDKGAYVTKAQTLLKQLGYDLGSCGIDGDFGKCTEAAVKAFQRDWGLTQDGVIGPVTWQYLTSAPVHKGTYTVTIPGLDLTKAKALLNTYPGSSMKEVIS